jgi:hypothetical protein
VTAGAHTGTRGETPAEAAGWRWLTAAPAPYPTAHQQARHELDVMCALIVASPTAAPSLEQLIASEHHQPEGALVLGALLRLTDYLDGAQFWWQFSAGGGSYTAASCLCLLHQSIGEPWDAEYWRHEADELARLSPSAVRTPAGRRPLVPRAVRTDLLSRCQDGLDVRLPPRMAAVLKGLPVAGEDDEYPEVPQVRPDTVARLTTAGRAGDGGWLPGLL